MNNEILNDGVINIGLHKGMVNLELGTEELSKKDDAGIVEIFAKLQIEMSLQVFLENYSSIKNHAGETD